MQGNLVFFINITVALTLWLLQRIKLLLLSLKVTQLDYLTSTIPSDKSKAAAWVAGDAMIRTLLWNSMDSKSSLPTMDEVFSQALRSTIFEKISSTPTVEMSAMLSHGPSGRGGQGRGRNFVHSGGREGRDGGVGTRGTMNSGNSRGSRYCHHCQRARHTEAYCYTLHPELRPPLAAYAEVEDSLVPPSTGDRIFSSYCNSSTILQRI
ncbi:hypothetical protein NL676_034897 [Syzygium grande]|nr:hypothetical protein NL676_034897 [Syzygium grande]